MKIKFKAHVLAISLGMVYSGLALAANVPANVKLHDPSEVVSEPEPRDAPSYASRTATKQYRTAPLHGLWQHPPYFHNGSAESLEAVVEMYNSKKSLGLKAGEKSDLVQYLKSL